MSGWTAKEALPRPGCPACLGLAPKHLPDCAVLLDLVLADVDSGLIQGLLAEQQRLAAGGTDLPVRYVTWTQADDFDQLGFEIVDRGQDQGQPTGLVPARRPAAATATERAPGACGPPECPARSHPLG